MDPKIQLHIIIFTDQLFWYVNLYKKFMQYNDNAAVLNTVVLL